MGDLDGVIALGDAQNRNAQAQAGAADTLADIPQKLAQADLTEAQAAHQQIQNFALSLGIQWDAQAHDHLLRERTLKLQRARQAEAEAQRFRQHSRQVYGLLAGRSWVAVRDGWMALDFIMGHVPAGVALKGMEIAPGADAFLPGSWKHSMHALATMPPILDPGELLSWARVGNYYPRLQGAAWLWIEKMLLAVDEGAKQAAAELDARTARLEADARELEKIDWERLKKQPESEDKK